jgi:hypothetical protein
MTTGPYQSRLLNQLTQQYRRLRDDLQQTWRKNTIAVVWGVQILLYPLYVATQGTRVLGRHLRQTVRRVLPPAPAVPPSVDTPLQTTLRSLPSLDIPAVWDEPVEVTVPPPPPDPPLTWRRAIAAWFTPSHRPAPPRSNGRLCLQTQQGIQPIQGIACQIERRTLVLVGHQGQLFDTLTPEQQTHLQQRMVAAIATYYRDRRLAIPPPPRSLPLPMTDDRVLPPMRWINQAIAWMQTGPVATQANLFQEAQLPAPAPPSPKMRSPWQILTPQWLPTLGTLVPYRPPAKAANPMSDWEPDQVSLIAVGPGWLQPYDPPATQMAVNELSPSDLTGPAEEPPSDPTSPGLTPAPQPSSTLDPGDPGWVETQALVVGYVKHPLEQVLEWLDISMVWLETRATSLWRWIQQHLPGASP